MGRDIAGQSGTRRSDGQPPSELSVGEQQRVTVARTLANKPTLILADEPTGDVDPDTEKEIINLLVAAVKEECATLIISTHGSSTPCIADRVSQLEGGVLKA